MAAVSGHVNIFLFFLSKQVSLHSKNAKGETAIELATKHGHQHLIKYLREKFEASLNSGLSALPWLNFKSIFFYLQTRILSTLPVGVHCEIYWAFIRSMNSFFLFFWAYLSVSPFYCLILVGSIAFFKSETVVKCSAKLLFMMLVSFNCALTEIILLPAIGEKSC